MGGRYSVNMEYFATMNTVNYLESISGRLFNRFAPPSWKNYLSEIREQKRISKLGNESQDRYDPLTPYPDFQFFQSSEFDFPNLGSTDLKRPFLDMKTYYNLPEIRETDHQRILAVKIPEIDLGLNDQMNFPVSFFSHKLLTRSFFRRSEQCHGIDLPKEVSSITGTESGREQLKQMMLSVPDETNAGKLKTATNRMLQQRYMERTNHTIKDDLQTLVKTCFPIGGNLQDMTLSLKPRTKGFKHALRLYFNNLKNHEPENYDFCLQAAQNISQQKKVNGEVQAFINTAVYQDETNLTHYLEELSAQDFDKSKCPIYLFINGDNQEKILERVKDVEKFMTLQSEVKSLLGEQFKKEDELDIKVVATQLDHYRHGLKTIPLNVALMDIALGDRLADKDIAAIYLDADIQKFSGENHVQ